MEKEFLPVGSVVLLKGGTKRIMVTGFCSVDNNDQEKMYDYTGCLYPEGIINSNEICLFDNNQIEQVFFKGYVDEEETKFKEDLNKTLANMSNTLEEDFEEDLKLEEDDDEEPTITFEFNDDILA
ncbi:MAG: DUF4176 domain-containing protein [Bacilli bacterium]|nr:DUF4176 domain-containing protein [Bacilli bacterium]